MLWLFFFWDVLLNKSKLHLPSIMCDPSELSQSPRKLCKEKTSNPRVNRETGAE